MLRKIKFWTIYGVAIALAGLYWLGEREQDILNRVLTGVDAWLGRNSP